MAEISNPSKVLWPEAGITKADLATYYDTVADRLLSHLRGRPVTLSHRPKGVEHGGFIRKDLPDHAPAAVGRWETWAHTARREVTYALIENREALEWCASQNVVEFHPCLFRVDRPDRLDVVVIDLDPAADSVSAAVAACWVKEVLDELAIVGELSLDGSVRPVRGVLSMAAGAKAEGRRGILVPEANAAEAAVVSGLEASLDVLEPADAAEWISTTLRPAVLSFQDEYESQCGLVFWMPAGAKRVTMKLPNEECMYRGRTELGRLLWSGDTGIQRVLDDHTPGVDRDGKHFVGLHHPRIS